MKRIIGNDLKKISGGYEFWYSGNTWAEPEEPVLPEDPDSTSEQDGETTDPAPDYTFDYDIDHGTTVREDESGDPIVPGHPDFEQAMERSLNADVTPGIGAIWWDVVEQSDGSYATVLTDLPPSLDAANYAVVNGQLGWFTDAAYVNALTDAFTAIGLSLPYLELDLLAILQSLPEPMTPEQIAQYIEANKETLSPVLAAQAQELADFIAQYGYNPLEDNGDSEETEDEDSFNDSDEDAGYDEPEEYDDLPTGEVYVLEGESEVFEEEREL